MLDRRYRGNFKTAEGQRGGVWRHARRLLVLAIVSSMVSGSLLVKVQAAAGDLDPTFSTDGKQRTVFGLKDELAYGVAVQTDGKIVIAGYTVKDTTGHDFALARYNENGTLDTTFSGDGKVTTDLFGGRDIPRGVAIQADGKILLAGESQVGGVLTDFALVRYNSDGTLDTTFDGDGIVTTDFGDEASALGLAIQGNGKIVLAGFIRGNDLDFALARYNTNGALDTTFSGDGKQTTDFGGSDAAYSVAIQSNGRIVAAGISDVGGSGRFALARYTNIGTLDTSFSADGRVTTAIGIHAEAHGVAIQADGKIVAAGLTLLSIQDHDFALVRYNGNGGLDDGSVNDRTPGDMFGTNGIVTTDFLGDVDGANAVAIQADNKIVAAGFAAHENNTNRDFALSRYNLDGSLDSTFSGDGKQTTGLFSSTRDEANAIAIQTDGKIVLAGFVGKTNSDFDFGLTRYLGN